MKPNKHLTATQLMARYSVCRRTLGRWVVQQGLNFPSPVEINRRRYWREDDLEVWEEERRTK